MAKLYQVASPAGEIIVGNVSSSATPSPLSVETKGESSIRLLALMRAAADERIADAIGLKHVVHAITKRSTICMAKRAPTQTTGRMGCAPTIHAAWSSF